MITVRLRGFEEAKEYFQAQGFPQQIESEGEKVLEKWARTLYNYTKSDAGHPWKSKSGRLVQSHRFARVGKLHWQVSADTRMGGGDKNYAIFLEYGSAAMGQDPFPWFRPAVEIHRKMIANEMKDSVKRVVLKVRPKGTW